ncbi:MAG: small acid-soluble spore protein SspI [Bacilli bacterium]|jgi:small acid-soluble spore protein I (minor)
MNVSIREYIKNNFKNVSKEEIRQTIEDSIKQDDEIVLPGLGVLFETVWNNSNQKEAIIDIIYNSLSIS